VRASHGAIPLWVGVRFEFLLYDVTSTFFDGQAMHNKKAARGLIKALQAVRPQTSLHRLGRDVGGPAASSTKSSSATGSMWRRSRRIVEAMEKRYRVAQRIWILDRAMVSEAH
jgi:hypothetical protein